MELGDYLEKETISIEYKEFCLKNVEEGTLPADFDNKFTTKIEKIVNENIEYYLTNVIPKYVSAFSNLQGNYKKGSVYIGVDDMGQITGIPYLNDAKLNTKKYKNEISLKIAKYLRITKSNGNILTENEKLRYLKNRMKMKIIQCSLNPNKLQDEYHNLTEKNRKRMEKNNKIIDNYLKKKREWYKNVRQYTMKMSILANNRKYRNDCIQYIQENCDDQELKERHIGILRQKKYLPIPKTRIFKTLKTDPNSIFYWIVTWKDYMIQTITAKRPEHPMVPPIPFNAHFLQQRLSHHRKRWIQNTPNIKYYVFKFQVCRSDKYMIEYRDMKQNAWLSVTRKNKAIIGPYCELL